MHNKIKNRINIISLLFAILIIWGSSGNTFAQDKNPNAIMEITKAFKQADEKKLALFFNSTIDLELPGTDGSYSKTQSEVIMHDFFNKYKVGSFVLNHDGSSNDGSKYMIGTYKTNNTELRLYILLKNKEDRLLIHQIQLEEE